MNCKKVTLLSILLLLLSLGSFAGADPGEGKGRRQPDDGGMRSGQRSTPKMVERVSARQQGEAIELRWQAVKGGCEGYRIYHEAGPALLPGSYWVDVDASRSGYLYRDVTAGGEYTFRVSALYGRNEGPLSAPVTVRMADKKSSGPSDTAL